jgi:hypothetical protein
MKHILQGMLAALLLCAAMACRAGDEEAPVIKLDDKALAKSGIEVARPAPASIRPRLRAYAAVLDPEPLTELRGRYAAARARLRGAQARLDASKTAFERARALYRDERNASLAELQAAEAAYRADEAALSAAQSEAQSLAASAAQAWGPVLGGALVEGAPLAARLIARSALLVQVTLAPGTALAQPPARASLDTGSGAQAVLALVSPAPRTDPRIQGTSFFYTVPAASGVLPGMQLAAWLPHGAPRAGVAVPPGAVVWWQDRAWIYRRSGAAAFTRVRIPTDDPAPGGGYLVSDLAPDSEIVTRGAQLLLSEEFRSQIEVGD